MSNRLSNPSDDRIPLLIEVTERLKRGEMGVSAAIAPDDEVGRLAQALNELSATLEDRYREFRRIDRITDHVNAGLLLDEILESVYHDFSDLIPYDRIGLALIDEAGETVRAHWTKSSYEDVHLQRGYSAPLAGSSLEIILKTGQPRIIDDLHDYLDAHPASESTGLVVREGLRSSLTCPLVVNGAPVGFIFFSSREPYTYHDVHVEIFQRIASQLAIIIEKGRLVSELTAQNAAIQRQNQELARLNELKNMFLGIAAHDLRSPLGVIQMALTFLLDYHATLPDDEREVLIKEAEEQVENMLVMINELLDITQIEAGELELMNSMIDVADFLAEAVNDHDRVARHKGTQVVLGEVPAGLVEGDPFRLRQVIDNLLSNAIKFSPPGSTVHVWAARGADEWRIYVRDQGPGISQADRERLFQHFARLSARPTGGERSTGLGLSITRRIVQQHGGTIEVESAEGTGATFWFTLPLEQPAREPGTTA